MISEFKSVFHSKLQMCANLCCCFCILKSSFCLIVKVIFCCNCLFHVDYTLGCSQWSLLYAELLLHCEELIVCPSLDWPTYCSLHILGHYSAFVNLFLLCYSSYVIVIVIVILALASLLFIAYIGPLLSFPAFVLIMLFCNRNLFPCLNAVGACNMHCMSG